MRRDESRFKPVMVTTSNNSLVRVKTYHGFSRHLYSPCNSELGSSIVTFPPFFPGQNNL